MTVPARRPRVMMRRRPGFSLRQTALGFGLVASLVCGGGLMLKTLVKSSDTHELLGIALAAGAVVVALGAVRRTRHRRRHPVWDGRAAACADGGLPQEPGPAAHGLAPGTPEADGEGDAETVDGVEQEASLLGLLDPVAFEQAVAALCERDGCRDIEVVGGAGDLGADVVATAPDGRHVVIQCKRYGPVNKVGSQDVQRFGGTCFAVHEAQVAAVVTTGGFTLPATEYAEQCGIVCFDAHALAAWEDGTGPAPWEVEVVAEADVAGC
ncbi:restriction endonuclease [Streptomyces sp. NPDC008141]|uniref:restriction endonuclease n=1 Tax=Streptomyces sp. NPDC008141 TaxID=3364815 RepID=UPI0036EC2FC7